MHIFLDIPTTNDVFILLVLDQWVVPPLSAPMLLLDVMVEVVLIECRLFVHAPHTLMIIRGVLVPTAERVFSIQGGKPQPGLFEFEALVADVQCLVRMCGLRDRCRRQGVLNLLDLQGLYLVVDLMAEANRVLRLKGLLRQVYLLYAGI
jgi:hypothetical protein